MKKDLSPYPPDRWIRTLNRRLPNLWTEMRRTLNDPRLILKDTRAIREFYGKKPEWCLMPTQHPFLALGSAYGQDYCISNMDLVMSIASMYTWRITKGVYRFAPEIYEALTEQPINDELPIAVLYRLPEWAVYVETPGLMFDGKELAGFIAHLDYNFFGGGNDLQFALFANGIDQPRMVALPLRSGSLTKAMEEVNAQDAAFVPGYKPRGAVDQEGFRHCYSVMLQLLLYLCSDEPDMPRIEHPRERMRKSGSIQLQSEPRVWDVGVRVSHAIHNFRLQQADTAENERGAQNGRNGHSRPRPHFRSAHWHTFWTGPRNADFPERKPVLRWLPPIPINMDWKHEMPVAIHSVIE